MSATKIYTSEGKGLPVRDLLKPLRLIISEEDCRRGNAKTPSSCAAALAACRLPKITEARIHIGRIFLNVANKYWLRGKTPGALRTEIVSFDRGGRFEPGEYTIRPLPPSDRPNGSRQGHIPVPKKRKGPKRKLKILKSIRGSAMTEYAYKGPRKTKVKRK
jgi:hypothetical protein